MAKIGIHSYGAYIPTMRMSRRAMFEGIGWVQGSLKAYAKGQRSYAQWDEDSVTMSVEACRFAMKHDDTPVERLVLASTTAPFLDRQNAGIVATALHLPAVTHCYDVAGSQRAALSPLSELTRSKSGSLMLAAAERSQHKPGNVMEFLSGHGAASLIIKQGAGLAELVDAVTLYDDFVDHYRTADSGTDYGFEDRWIREAGLGSVAPKAITQILEANSLMPEDIDHFILPMPNPSFAKGLAKSTGIAAEAVADPLFENLGHCGTAHPLVMLANVLDCAVPDQWILLTAFGQGFETVLIRTTQALADHDPANTVAEQLAGGHAEDNYVKFLVANDRLDVDWGMRAERDNRTAQTVAYDKRHDIYGFVGGLCESCGTPQFPKSRRCVNPDCGALDTQIDYRFAEIAGEVKSFTEDHMTFTRQPPLLYGNISCAGGGNIFMEMTGFMPGEVEIGTPTRMYFRIKDIDKMRGFHRYFWKAGPVVTADEGENHG
ncbi:MAG: 3-oxoacyl-[acyl-carrier-protein] synthase III C-terminal domain-containing protein [Parvibaculales bacterium]